MTDHSGQSDRRFNRLTGVAAIVHCRMDAKTMKHLVLCWLVVASLATGCASLEDFKYRSVNHARAAAAWREARACMPKECANPDFAFGFKEGYYAVATGSGSCPPIVPPPKYFHARYQSTEGQWHVNQWYRGYQSGTIAADRDGRALWAEVPTQDGPGCNCQCSPMTTDAYHTDVIEVPVDTTTSNPL